MTLPELITALPLPPYLWFYLAALLVVLTQGAVRALVTLAAPVVSVLLLIGIEPGIHLTINVLDYQLVPYYTDRLSLLFVYLFHIAAFIGQVYSLHLRDTVQQVAGLLYAGSAVGAVLAGDLLTLFIFWELLSVTSVFLVWARRTPRAIASGQRYLIIQVLSGVLLFVGAMVQLSQTGSLTFGYVGLDGAVGWLLFLAFGIKCGFPLLHNWITDAYPEATPTGAVFLSAFTTKVAVYALARGFPGEGSLIYIGAIMTCFPIFYAVIENDLRRVLAYSLISQIGFMVCGIGIGTALALNGAVAHAFVHVIYKALLFMSMGAVLLMTGRINGADLGGLYKTMPRTTALCIIGAASISALPLFSGFVSKSMIISALLHEHHSIAWLALLFASAGVIHYAGIKIPYFAFFAHDSGIRAREPPLNMLIAMAIAALPCIIIGVFPTWLYRLLPWEMNYTPYDVSHVLTQLQLIFFSAMAFTWLNLRGVYPPELHSVNLDVEWLYRKLGPRAIDGFDHAVRRRWHALTASLRQLGNRWFALGKLSYRAGGLPEKYSTSAMLVWVALMLIFFVILSST